MAETMTTQNVKWFFYEVNHDVRIFGAAAPLFISIFPAITIYFKVYCNGKEWWVQINDGLHEIWFDFWTYRPSIDTDSST